MDGSGNVFTTIQRITYATDTATATVRGPYFAEARALAGSGNDTFGYFGAGAPLASPSNSILGRITYANDTVVASERGPLSAALYARGSAAGVQ
jgi:hypothetical protein